MNYIAPRAEPLIREIPLSRLAFAPENVRKTPPDPRADAELKASIAALGLFEIWSSAAMLPIRKTPTATPWSPADAASRPCRRWSRTR